MNPQRIGIVGGSLDPIHLGHLIIAQEACEQLGLDRAVFVPASQAPLKNFAPQASDAQRLEMTRRAISDNPRFGASSLEIEAGGTSFSIETARTLQTQFPDAELFWVLGDDQLAQLHRWREIESLCAIVHFVALERDSGVALGAEAPAHLPANCRLTRLKGHPFSVSSSEIRRRIATGQEFRYFLHPLVFDYIKAENLYRQLNRNE